MIGLLIEIGTNCQHVHVSNQCAPCAQVRGLSTHYTTSSTTKAAAKAAVNLNQVRAAPNSFEPFEEHPPLEQTMAPKRLQTLQILVILPLVGVDHSRQFYDQ